MYCAYDCQFKPYILGDNPKGYICHAHSNLDDALFSVDILFRNFAASLGWVFTSPPER